MLRHDQMQTLIMQTLATQPMFRYLGGSTFPSQSDLAN